MFVVAVVAHICWTCNLIVNLKRVVDLLKVVVPLLMQHLLTKMSLKVLEVHVD